jgi:hypothetical protein
LIEICTSASSVVVVPFFLGLAFKIKTFMIS